MPQLDAIGVIVSDMARAIDFYRMLGLEFEGDEVHAEAPGPGGLRVMLDSEASMMSFSDWQPPSGGGPRTALAFLCDTPADVDRLFE
ncbi:MAG TPA: VOC family protein, partial [Acidimicrobiia bacterium]|nr:VOC family protein [Acidimicrobiia bacterium]